jgi:MFS family permease
MKQAPLPFASFVFVITALYMSQGLPGGLIAHALPAFLREEGVSLVVIGSLKLLALPWLFKFLWAPLIDRGANSQARVAWILRMQSLMIVSLLALSWTISSISLSTIFVSVAVLLLINLASATQDIATDGLTVSQTPPKYLGLANSIQVAAYKVGMLLGGSGLLLLSPYFEIPELVRLLSMVVAVLLLPVLFFKRKYLSALDINRTEQPTQANREGMMRMVYTSYRDFFSQSGLRYWLLVLVTYKISDSLGSTMFKPMLVDNGVILSDIGYLTLYSTAAGLFGAALAGGLYRIMGMKWSLLLFGLMQSLSVSSFYAVNAWDLTIEHIYALALIEQFCDGLSTVALFAVMMVNCRKGHEGADYTIQASLQIGLAGLIGALSGLLASIGGYVLVYALCVIFGVLSFFLVLRYVGISSDKAAVV